MSLEGLEGRVISADQVAANLRNLKRLLSYPDERVYALADLLAKSLEPGPRITPMIFVLKSELALFNLQNSAGGVSQTYAAS